MAGGITARLETVAMTRVRAERVDPRCGKGEVALACLNWSRALHDLRHLRRRASAM